MTMLLWILVLILQQSLADIRKKCITHINLDHDLYIYIKGDTYK